MMTKCKGLTMFNILLGTEVQVSVLWIENIVTEDWLVTTRFIMLVTIAEKNIGILCMQELFFGGLGGLLETL